MTDIRDAIFKNVADSQVTASIIADGSGILSGAKEAMGAAWDLGLSLEAFSPEGASLCMGDEVMRFSGSPKQIAIAEERLIGLMAKPSGIATMARSFAQANGGRPKIVAGAWKKMPGSFKSPLRQAIDTGGLKSRISEKPFLYLDKNFVRMLGGLEKTLMTAKNLGDYMAVVQIRGEFDTIQAEAVLAARLGAGVIFVDSGDKQDLQDAIRAIKENGLENDVKMAFGGAITLEDVEMLKAMDVDILDVGRAIVDAPLLDMRLEVTHVATWVDE